VRVKAEGGWWLARASNTQPAVIVRCEAPDQEALERLMAMVEEQLRLSGVKTTLEEAMQTGHH
jgi:phosphomannomutase